MMNKRWFEVVMTRLLSLKNPFLIYAVMTHLSARLACKVLDSLELEVLQELNKVRDDTNG
jgi:hypothetical protein